MELLNVGMAAKTPKPGDDYARQHRPVADRVYPAHPMSFPPDQTKKLLNYGNYKNIPAEITLSPNPVPVTGDKDAPQEYYEYRPKMPEAIATQTSGQITKIAVTVGATEVKFDFTNSIDKANLDIYLYDSYDKLVHHSKVAAAPVGNNSVTIPAALPPSGSYKLGVKYEAQTLPYFWFIQR